MYKQSYILKQPPALQILYTNCCNINHLTIIMILQENKNSSLTVILLHKSSQNIINQGAKLDTRLAYKGMRGELFVIKSTTVNSSSLGSSNFNDKLDGMREKKFLQFNN